MSLSLFLILGGIFVLSVPAMSTTENYKDQFCTDPRTMKKHAAYSEWADAYSCTRHRCQPGGRSLAIYTVGCKRVEAPESAIECEEVVEDTNIQFPYCCTRLRCLVVVRGEVWTRVLGQPWEALPAAPWSHMYKMKKPPPGDSTFSKKGEGEGPIYELNTDNNKHEEATSGRKMHNNKMADIVDENSGAPSKRVQQQDSPDIVIALSTGNDKSAEPSNRRAPRARKHSGASEECEGPDCDQEAHGKPDKSEPRWAQVSAVQYNDNDDAIVETENAAQNSIKSQELADLTETLKGSTELIKGEKPVHLQALVDAIGTRMRDIEDVVQKMSDKVNKGKATDETANSAEKKSIIIPQDADFQEKKLKKRTNMEGEKYRRFNNRNRNKYLTTRTEASSEPPLFVEDGNLNGYFSGASNVLRRGGSGGVPAPKEPSEPAIYMAPVLETRSNGAKSRSTMVSSDEVDNLVKHKRLHKKKKKPIVHHKRHHARGDLKKGFNKITSIENNVVNTIEDNSSAQT